MGRIVIGTSGYSYKDWKGVFYPEDLSSKDYLSYYSKHFSSVELNFSYYKQPEASHLERMLLKTEDDFLFTVKAHQSLTHDRGDGWKEEGRRFIEGISPMAAAKQLAAVLLQFPYSFHYTRENRIYLARLCEFLKVLMTCLWLWNSGTANGSRNRCTMNCVSAKSPRSLPIHQH